jgi:regulator of protease activity HflC (stomatin/prohibitin superfamily)
MDSVIKAWTVLTTVIILIIAGLMAGLPAYNVYSSRRAGEAELAQATYNRQIKVQEAQASEEAAKSLAQAEVIRASGVAQANKIIGESLKGNEAYLHYLWLHSLEDTKNQIIYVPTETNMPILEANRIGNTPAIPSGNAQR